MEEQVFVEFRGTIWPDIEFVFEFSESSCYPEENRKVAVAEMVDAMIPAIAKNLVDDLPLIKVHASSRRGDERSPKCEKINVKVTRDEAKKILSDTAAWSRFVEDVAEKLSLLLELKHG